MRGGGWTTAWSILVLPHCWRSPSAACAAAAGRREGESCRKTQTIKSPLLSPMKFCLNSMIY